MISSHLPFEVAFSLEIVNPNHLGNVLKMASIDTRRISVPIKSKFNRKMGERTTEIRPVGAWVQYEPVYLSGNNSAVVSLAYIVI